MKAILITGPPGAGKSPLGDYLEIQELRGRKLWHLDFGRQLREIINLSRSQDKHRSSLTRDQKTASLQSSEIEVNPNHQKIISIEEYFNNQELERICQSVETASLFEEKDRKLVRKILRYFLEKTKGRADDILALNGLPRHQGQLSWLEDLISLELVINLICPEKIAIKRILANLDGERLGREDDREEVIARRYRLYQERTEPLINYFRKGKIPVMDLMVGQKTTPEMLWRQIQSSSFFWQIL